jgi:hypothetical protein
MAKGVPAGLQKPLVDVSVVSRLDLRVHLFNLHRGCLVGQGSNEGVPVPKLLACHGSLGFDDGVDSSDLVCDLPRALEQQGIVDGSSRVVVVRHV